MLTRSAFKTKYGKHFGYYEGWRQEFEMYKSGIVPGWMAEEVEAISVGHTHSLTGRHMDLLILDDIVSKPAPFGHFTTPAPMAPLPYGAVAAKQEKPMQHYVDIKVDASQAKTDDAKTRHLIDRLDRVRRAKESKLPELFHLYVDNSPKTFKDLIAAIKEGKYTIDPKVEKKLALREEEGDSWYHDPFYGIVWDGPQEDRKGYDKALEALKAAHLKAKDEIIVLSDEQARLAALRAFEDFDVSTATAQ